jgi:hypothetical protein
MNINNINPRLSVQEVKLEEDSLRFVIPFSMSVSGPSQSNFLLNQLIKHPFSRTIYSGKVTRHYLEESIRYLV